MTRLASRWPWLLLPAGAILGFLGARELRGVGHDWTFTVVDTLVGVTLIGAGVFVWNRRPENRCWWLLALAGFTWFFSTFHVAASEENLSLAAFALGRWFDFFLAWLLLAFPTGRLQARRDRILLVAMAALFAARSLSRLFLHVPPDFSGCDCVENRFFPVTDPQWFDRVESGFAWGFTILAVLALASVAERWMRASRPRRYLSTPALVAGAVMVAALAYDLVVRPRVQGQALSQEEIYYVLCGSRIVVGLAFVVGLLRVRSTRAGVVDLVADLGSAASPTGLGDLVGRALGDPSVQLLAWSHEREAYLDDRGRAVDPPDRDPTRAVTYIERGGEPVAALTHDPALLEDPALMSAVAGAVRLTIDNERLTTELQAQLQEVEASRARIVEAGDEARRRIERDLHDGAQQRLVTVALALRLLASRADVETSPEVHDLLLQSVRDLGEAVDELRDLARGIHPAILGEAGLGDALQSLADRSPVPTRLEVRLEDEPSSSVAATLYFAAAEALTNVVKHAGAASVVVGVAADGSRLRLEVVDDGVGGARSSAGSGLSGLADRVAAQGGTMRVTSPAGEGTRVEVALPCGSS